MAYRQGFTTSFNRLEAKTINELRLGVLGLNRVKIQKYFSYFPNIFHIVDFFRIKLNFIIYRN